MLCAGAGRVEDGLEPQQTQLQLNANQKNKTDLFLLPPSIRAKEDFPLPPGKICQVIISNLL